MKKRLSLFFALLLACACLILMLTACEEDEHTHTPNSAVREKEMSATCTSVGSYDEVVYCSDCGEEISRITKSIEKLPHTPSDWITDTEATCKLKGKKHKECTVCHTELETSKIDKLTTHTPADAVRENEVNSKCDAAGSYDEVVYCSVCNIELSREEKEIAKPPHTEVTDVAKAPSCTETGLTEGKHCAVCNEVLVAQETVRAKGHIDENSDYTCDVCRADLCIEHEEEIIPAVSATCTETGLTEGKKCSICGDILVAQETVKANGHSYTVQNTDSKYLDKAADCENAATYFYSCACGDKGTTTFTHGEPNGHIFVVEKADIDYQHTPATEYSAAIYYKSCACGKASATETFTYGDMLPGYLTYKLSEDSSYYIVTGYVGAQAEISVPHLYDGLPVFVIMEGAFRDNTYIHSITMPNSIQVIGAYAFANCTALESITIPTSVSDISPHTFSECTALETITLHSGIDVLGAYAFEKCSALKSITLNEGLKTISDNAFDYCTALESILIPDTVTTLGNMAFRHAESLGTVKFSKALKSIGNSTFQYCVKLESVELHENITTLGNSTFSYCDGLKSIRILGDLTAIGTATFYECRSLEAIYYASSTPGNCGDLNYIFYNAGINGEGITLTIAKDAVIPEGFFTPYVAENMPKITNIIIEDGSTVVSYALQYNELPYLTEVIYPSTVTEPCYGAFNNSPWWDNQNFGEVFINGIFYGYKCHCYMATPEEPVTENYHDSTCTEDGSFESVIYCEACNDELSRKPSAILKKGHDYVDHAAKAASCTNIGWNAYQTCSRCDYTSYEEIEALGHDYIDYEAKAVSCTDIGWDAYQTCSRCDYTSYEEIEALGHDYIDHEAKAATCTDIGWDAYQTCSRCDYTSYEEIEALGHDYIDHEAKAATCTDIGWNAYQTCTHCHYTSYEEIEALGHDYINHEAKAATCTDIGWNAYQTCSRCDYTSYEEIEALGHDYIDHEAKTVSCTDIGWDAYQSCSRCSYSTYEEIAALGHSERLAVKENLIKPTCTSNGSYDSVIYCDVCDTEISRTRGTMSALGHSECSSVEENRVEPTCIKDGSCDIVVYCANCSDELSREKMTLSLTRVHDTNDGYCVNCNMKESTAGLIFSLNADNMSYTLTEIGTCTESDIVIGSYNNLSVTSIGASAFEGYEVLTSIELSESITSIGSYAFSGCKALASIDIPNNVTNIGSRAFMNCEALTSINIPDGINSIGAHTFLSCKSLKCVTIGSGVERIDRYAFSHSESLEAIIVNENNPAYKCMDGNLYSKDGTTLILYAQGKTDTEFTIPNGVIYIGQYAFKNSVYLKVISFSNSVKSIGEGAFSYCKNLTNVTLTSSVTSIGDSAFSSCYKLTNINIPEGVASIGNKAFGWSGIKNITIPDSVTYIGESVFYHCQSLSTVTLGDGITSLDSEFFKNCSMIESISIPFVGANKTATGYMAHIGYAFGYTANECADTYHYYDSETGLYYTYNIPTTLKHIEITGENNGEFSLSGCDNLEILTVPFIGASKDAIGFASHFGYIFGYTSSTEFTSYDYHYRDTELGLYYTYNIPTTLKEVIITDGKVGNHAFRGCATLTNITLPQNLTEIGTYAFYYCKNLTAITIPDGIISIGERTFGYCYNLVSITVPKSLKSIGWAAFDYCNSLKDLHVSDIASLCEFGAIYDGFSNLYLNGKLVTELVIPTGVKSIGNGAFRFSCITSVAIPNSVTTIGSYAFAGCSITDITIPNSVTSIGSGVFSDCQYLKTIKLPNSITSIADSSFYKCSNLESINIPNGITKIEDGAFKFCNRLVNIVLPESVSFVGSMAFYSCNNLTSVTIKNTSSIKFGSDAFRYCYKLVEVVNKSTETITVGSNSYGYLAYYAKIVHTAESKLVKVGDFYFITIDGVNYLTGQSGDDTEITLPNNYNGNDYQIYDYAFYQRKDITSIVLPNGITIIGSYAFDNCTGITMIVIPDSVTHIGKYAFCDCNNLSSMTFESNATWYRTSEESFWKDKVGGEKIYFNNPRETAGYFKSAVGSYYWYKK